MFCSRFRRQSLLLLSTVYPQTSRNKLWLISSVSLCQAVNVIRKDLKRDTHFINSQCGGLCIKSNRIIVKPNRVNVLTHNFTRNLSHKLISEAQGAGTICTTSTLTAVAVSRSTHNVIEDALDSKLKAPIDALSKFLATRPPPWIEYLDASDSETEKVLSADLIVMKDFVTVDEEKALLAEIEPYLKRLRYEFQHWDDAIHGYRETERKNWTEKNKAVIERARFFAFPAGTSFLPHLHVLDLDKKGYIKPHVDAVRFCGSVVSGLNLMSSAVMRLVHTEDKAMFGDALIPARSLYIIRNKARFDFTHEVLGEEQSFFRGNRVERDRRISIISRSRPEDSLT